MTLSAQCPACSNPQSEGSLCANCTLKLERALGDVRSIVDDLNISLSKQAKLGGGGSAGLARERSPLNFGAVEMADNLNNVLTTWAREVSDTAGWVWVASKTPPAVQSAAALLVLVNTIRRHPAVDELVDEITDAIEQARKFIDRAPDRIYVGQCRSEGTDEYGQTVDCGSDLYARPGAAEVRCKVCGAETVVQDQRKWLLKQIEGETMSVKAASYVIGDFYGTKVTEASIRGLIHREKLGYVTGKMIRLGDLLELLTEKRVAA